MSRPMRTLAFGRMWRRAASLAMIGATRVATSPRRSSLSVPQHDVARPRFAAIDAHDHLRGPFSAGWGDRSAGDLERLLDASGVERIVDLDGEFGHPLELELERFRGLGDRVAVFAAIDYGLIGATDDFGQRMADELRRSADAGARGLKVWKTLGLHARDGRGDLVPIDDERLDPLWDAAAEVRLPIMIHVADPMAFFEPLRRTNERWEELRMHPEWHYWPPRPRGHRDHPRFPSHQELLDQFRSVLRGHPQTTFIGAHLAGAAEDLGVVGEMLDEHANLFVDISARIAEIGRQPYSAHDLFVRHADRVLFGSDHAGAETYSNYFRLLETRDEYFEYGGGPRPLNGNWRIYGLGLPDHVLEQIYHRNARRIIWGGD